MQNFKLLTLRIPSESHQDLKLLSAVTKRSMTDLFLEMIEDYKSKVMNDSQFTMFIEQKFGETSDELSSVQKKIEQQKSRAIKKQEIIEQIVQMRRKQKMTYDEIAKALENKGISTITGKGSWQRGTVFKLYNEWEKKHGKVAEFLEQESKWALS